MNSSNSSNWRSRRPTSDTSPQSQSSTYFDSPYSRRKESFDRYPRSRFFGSSRSRSPERSDEPTARGSLRKPINDAKAEQAINEGRRLYVGSMPYEATIKDVENFFSHLSYGIEAINMSVDPMTGRNPSYCFIDFISKEMAYRVMAEYNGRDFMRRPLKVKPGVKSGTGTGRYDLRPTHKVRDIPAATERWTRLESPEDQQDATREGRRLYIGNLPRFQNYLVANQRIRELLKDYEVITVSKLISPIESSNDTSCYCFVDLATYAQVDQAIKSLNGSNKFPCPKALEVSRATGISKKLGERRRIFFGGLPEFEDQDALEMAVRDFFAGYKIATISKLFSSQRGRAMRDGSNHRYCFVEMETEEETDRSILNLDWKNMWGGKVRVKPSTSVKPDERESKIW
ncbi:hypothetical protein K3495_g654 [Podosphaera aphanis]|nr:hypothetical protein K3495_g654 [Podosphaera aphanis]